ncbi:MAG: CHAP domain-containing protein, partial [Acidimicrobiales bacterium]
NNATPAVGPVAVDPSGVCDHVAFVTARNGTDITVSQYNQNEDRNSTTQTGAPVSLGFTSFDHF